MDRNQVRRHIRVTAQMNSAVKTSPQKDIVWLVLAQHFLKHFAWVMPLWLQTGIVLALSAVKPQL